jgi:hypothetical protein
MHADMPPQPRVSRAGMTTPRASRAEGQMLRGPTQ